jgi:hypothetical protein
VTHRSTQTPRDTLAKCLVLSLLLSATSVAQNESFHNAPASAKTEKDPHLGQNTVSGKTSSR